jgi:hypothetical protein
VCVCVHKRTLSMYMLYNCRSARVIIMTDAQLRKQCGKYLHGHYQLGIFAASSLSLCSLAAYFQTTPAVRTKLYCMG